MKRSGQLLVQSVTPLALEVALNVQSEIQSRLAEAERLRQQQVQRAQYEAERAQVRYMRVDPNNRLVADTLETQWNEKLRLLAQAKEECQQQQRLGRAATHAGTAGQNPGAGQRLPPRVAGPQDSGPGTQAHGAAAAGRRDVAPRGGHYRAGAFQGRRHAPTPGAACPSR